MSLFAGIGLIYGLVPIISVGTNYYPDESGSLIKAALVVVVGLLSLSAGFHLTQRSTQEWSSGLSPKLISWVVVEQNRRLLIRFFYIAGVFGILCLLLRWTLMAGSISGIFSMARFEGRFEGGVLGVALRHGAGLAYIPAFIGIFISRKHFAIGLVYAVVVALLIFLVSKGSRAMPMGVLAAPLFSYIITQRISLRRFGMVTAIAAVIVFASVGAYEVRKVMQKSSYTEIVHQFISLETYAEATDRDPLNYNQVLIAAVKYFPSEHPYLHGAAYRRLLFFYIPSTPITQILKPADSHVIFAVVVGGSKKHSNLTTIPPSIFGEPYINLYGFPGVVLVMCLTGVFISWIARKIADNLLVCFLIGPHAVGASIASLRGQTYEVATTLLSALIIGGLVFYVAGYRRAHSRSPEHSFHP